MSIGIKIPRVKLPSIPLVAIVWQYDGLAGDRRTIIEDTDLQAQGFEGTTSAISVRRGPHYDAVKSSLGYEPTVGLYGGLYYFVDSGPVLVLGRGEYPSIDQLFNFSGVTRSVRFNPTSERFPLSPREGPPFATIPLIVELTGPQTLITVPELSIANSTATIIEEVSDVGMYLGSDWSTSISAVQVKSGPNYSPGRVVKLYEETNHSGGQISLGPGNYDLSNPQYDFVGKTKSIGFA